jgi:hypothetical protein
MLASYVLEIARADLRRLHPPACNWFSRSDTTAARAGQRVEAGPLAMELFSFATASSVLRHSLESRLVA